MDRKRFKFAYPYSILYVGAYSLLARLHKSSKGSTIAGLSPSSYYLSRVQQPEECLFRILFPFLKT